MKKIVWTFGLISGGILAALMAVTAPLCMDGKMGDYAELIGYTAMVLAFVLVFFAIRSYRENVGGGTITFGKAFKVGLLVCLIASTGYVVTWEIVYYGFLPDFADRYAAHTLQKMQAKGATPQAIEKATQEMAKFKVWYRNPLLNVGMTYVEVFPVGLIVTLVSAAILRKKTPPAPTVAAVAS
ncbi:MAG: DUF4199 domain-containing protein [Thermoanaerobaculia bacterium]|nr:DUF4199 domain-containing protein [Thermoanaerobaculia bacterium]